MKIVIPISHSDNKQPSRLVDLMLAFGGLKDHSVLVFHTPAATIEATTVADRLKSSVRQIDVRSTEEELVYGMPANASIMFHKCIIALHKLGNKEPWLWNEPDALPSDFGAYNTIERSYKQCGRLFMGCIVPVPKITDNQVAMNPTKEQIKNSGDFLSYTPGDDMMMGVAVYPANIWDILSMRALIMDLGKKPPLNPTSPFDVYLRGEQRLAGWDHTDTIADMWCTYKYEENPNGLVCKTATHLKTKVTRDREGFVPPQAVLIHGCKDNTLYDILVAKSGMSTTLSGEKSGPEDIALPVLGSRMQQFADTIEARLKVSAVRLNNLAIEMKRQRDLGAFTQELQDAGFVIAQAGWVRRGTRKPAMA